MKTISIDVSGISDWTAFHDFFAKTFGFPTYYGKNMNAWIDCMGDVLLGESIFLHINRAKGLKERCPDIWDALIECSAFLNYRQHEVGKGPVISLSYFV